MPKFHTYFQNLRCEYWFGSGKIGSHTGAEAAALYHSLAITCHRCGINVFEYFCDIIDRCAAWPPNTPIEKYRDLLPDRWKPAQK